MKRTLFALALLVPAFASAAVKLDLQAHCDDEIKTESWIFSGQENKHTIILAGITAEFSLIAETAEAASFKVVVKEGETVRCNEKFSVAYNAEETFACPHEGVNAEVIVKATLLSVTE